MGLWRLVGLEPAQWRRALSLWGLLFALTAAFELTRGIVVSIYLERLGGRDLALVIVLEGVLRIAAAGLYFFLFRRLSYGRLMVLTSLGYAAALGLLATSLSTADDSMLRLSFALERVAFNLVTLHWGVYLVDFFTVRESSTAFPFVHSAEPLAAVPAGLLLVALPATASPLSLFLLPAALLAAALVLTRVSSKLLAESPRMRIAARAEDDDVARPSPWRYVRTASIVRTMALASTVLIFVRADLEVTYGQVLADLYGSAGEIRHFWGWYVLVSNAVVFVLQFLLSARMTKALAPTRVNMSYSVVVLLSFAALLFLPGLPTVVLSKFVREELKSLLKTPFSAMIYGAMADYARPHARMAVFGVVMPVASIASGLLLMAAGSPSSAAWFALPGLAGSVLFVAVTFLQNRAYKLALVDLLHLKLGLKTVSGLTSSLLRIPDARQAEITRVRSRPDYYLVRGRYARALFPLLYAAPAVAATASRSQGACPAGEHAGPEGSPLDRLSPTPPEMPGPAPAATASRSQGACPESEPAGPEGSPLDRLSPTAPDRPAPAPAAMASRSQGVCPAGSRQASLAGEGLELLEELLLAVELYRPRGAPHLRGFLVTALKDRRVDLRDNAVEVISSILPPRLAARGRTLLSAALETGVPVAQVRP